MNKDQLLASIQYDHSAVDYDAPDTPQARLAWEAMIRDMATGAVVKISESVYDYFLDVLPPLTMFKGGFVFGEGVDYPRYFYYLGNDTYVMQERQTAVVDSSAYVYDDWRGPAQLKPVLTP